MLYNNELKIALINDTAITNMSTLNALIVNIANLGKSLICR